MKTVNVWILIHTVKDSFGNLRLSLNMCLDIVPCAVLPDHG